MGDDDKLKIYGLRIKQVRTAKGLNQAAMAGTLGLSRPSYTQIESGHTIPTTKVFTRLISEFKVSPNWLYLGTGPMFLEDESGVDYIDNSPGIQEIMNRLFDDPAFLIEVQGLYGDRP